jgi:hypothetical protein
LDPIEDYLLREEGFSGRARKTVVEGIVPLMSVEYDVLEIDARMRRIAADFQSQSVCLSNIRSPRKQTSKTQSRKAKLEL